MLSLQSPNEPGDHHNDFGDDDSSINIVVNYYYFFKPTSTKPQAGKLG